MEIEEQFVPYRPLVLDEDDSLHRSREFYAFMKKRRTVRSISTKPVEREVMENIVKTACTSPSGVNKQPWMFCLVGNMELKKAIRKASEEEEQENYSGRMNEEWMEDVKPFATSWEKPYLEDAPWLIVVFKKMYGEDQGMRSQNYHVNESTGIACGILLTAVHHAGLVAMPYTSGRMGHLLKILKRPANERPFLIFAVGYPSENAMVPSIARKPLSETTATFM